LLAKTPEFAPSQEEAAENTEEFLVLFRILKAVSEVPLNPLGVQAILTLVPIKETTTGSNFSGCEAA
jgi:hypothetical protein